MVDLEGSQRCRGEIGRTGPACHVSVAGTIHGDAIPPARGRVASGILMVATEEGRIDERRTRRIKLGHEGIKARGTNEAAAIAAAVSLRGIQEGEVARTGITRDVSVARRVNRDALTGVIVAAAEICGIDERGTRGVQLWCEK